MRIISALLLVVTSCSGSTAPSSRPAQIEVPLSSVPPDAGDPSATPQTKMPELDPVSACTGMAMAFVVDRSGSMSGAPLESAKTAVIDGAALLGPDDCVTVIAFDSSPTRVVPLRSAAMPIQPEVLALTAGGGTQILTALDRAHRDLARATMAKKKHALLLTDGQAPTAGIRELVKQMATEGMTVSSIALGSSTDEALLKTIASEGGARYFPVNDVSKLSPVFRKDVAAALK
jgi:Mg-chelatase subunit ChlD